MSIYLGETPLANTGYDKANTDLSNLTSTGQETLVDLLYPVGSVYIGITSTCPLAAIKGTWELVSSGRVLQGADSNHTAGTTIEAGLPNITGELNYICASSAQNNLGAFSQNVRESNVNKNTSSSGGENMIILGLNASRSSSIYGNSSTVQPPAYCVNIWKRTA